MAASSRAAFNPRAGYFPASYRDLSVPLGDDVTQRFIIRHRLVKKNPACLLRVQRGGADRVLHRPRGAGADSHRAARGRAVVGPGVPRGGMGEVGRSAWSMLPADADPMDVRYNIIQWVHRYTRGWSYGSAVVDPRTGEILKGNVTLGSAARAAGLPDRRGAAGAVHRKRGWHQWHAWAQLEGPPGRGRSDAADGADARIRQLAAHETGHTLGLAHNFAASTIAQSDSVMDYPHPYITMDPDRTSESEVGVCGEHRRLGQGGDQLWLSPVHAGRERTR